MMRGQMTPSRLQSHPAECGSVCLGILLEHHGIHLPAVNLRRLCSVSRDGASVAQIQRGAHMVGFDCRITKKGLEALYRLPGPAIIHWDMRHFVVLEKLNNDTVLINDPALGHRRLSKGEFLRHYTGICVEIERGETLEVTTPPIHQTNLFDLLPESVAQPLWLVSLTVFSGILLFMLDLLFINISQVFFDYVVDLELSDWGYILVLCGFPLIVFKNLVDYFHSTHLLRTELNATTRIRYFFLGKLIGKPASFFESHYAGELLQRSSEVERYLSFLIRLYSQAGTRVFVAAASGAILFLVSPLIGLLNLIPYCALMIWTALHNHRIRELSIRQQQDSGQYFTILVQRVETFLRFYVMGVQEHLLTTCLPTLTRAQASNVEVDRYLLQHKTATEFLAAALPPLSIFLGCFLLIEGELSYGTFLLTVFATNSFVSQIGEIAKFPSDYAEVTASTQRAAEILREDEDAPETPSAPITAPFRSDEIIRACSLSFGYNGLDATLFQDVNLSIKHGEFVCLTGDSGCGKTTLMEVLSGQRPPTGGAVFFENEALEGPAPCGFVFADEDFLQDALIPFIGGSGNVDQARVLSVLALVELDTRLGFFVAGDGLECLAEQGLSRGEIQRLSLAQALYRSTDCVFFDEAFSHLSLAQSRRIVDRLRDEGVTVILASHRPEIQALCDRCIVVPDFRNAEVQ